MNASMKRGLSFSSVTVSASIAPTPGSRSSGERSRSGSYIGCGNDGVDSTVAPGGGAAAAPAAPAPVTRA